MYNKGKKMKERTLDIKRWREKGVCPFCGSDNWKMKYSSYELERAQSTFKCSTCDNLWNDVFVYSTTVKFEGQTDGN